MRKKFLVTIMFVMMLTFSVGSIAYADTSPPQVVSINLQPNGDVYIYFNEPVTFASATNLNNYAIQDATILNAFSPTSNLVVLDLSTSDPAGPGDVLYIWNIKDLSGNTLVQYWDYL